jgi:hypothetical protein
MATIQLPPDLKGFLRLPNANGGEYLVGGGYAVGLHGFPTVPDGLDIWIAATPENARKLERVLVEFGFNPPGLSCDLFLEKDRIIRMGVPPIRIELPTFISGVVFQDCYPSRRRSEVDGLRVDCIGLEPLTINKRAAGRHQDLSDLERLP